MHRTCATAIHSALLIYSLTERTVLKEEALSIPKNYTPIYSVDWKMGQNDWLPRRESLYGPKYIIIMIIMCYIVTRSSKDIIWNASAADDRSAVLQKNDFFHVRAACTERLFRRMINVFLIFIDFWIFFTPRKYTISNTYLIFERRRIVVLL